jgi:hypothetical protein
LPMAMRNRNSIFVDYIGEKRLRQLRAAIGTDPAIRCRGVIDLRG